jgi:hypothetical protein
VASWIPWRSTDPRAICDDKKANGAGEPARKYTDMLKKPALFSLCVAALGVAAFAVFQGDPAELLLNRKAFSFTGPTNPTSSQVAAFLEAKLNGTQLPSGWSVTGSEGQVQVVDTGLVLYPSNERQWSVTVIDETADISTATIYLDDEDVYTATRANGGIVDRLGKGIATLPVLVPPASQAFELKATWTANDGVTIRSCGALIP